MELIINIYKIIYINIFHETMEIVFHETIFKIVQIMAVSIRSKNN